MTTRIPVFVHAGDPISEAGLVAGLRPCPDITLIPQDRIDVHTVVVCASQTLGEATLRTLRRVNQLGCRRILLVTDALTEDGLLEVVEVGVCAVVRRAEATGPRLAQSILSVAAGEGSLPPDLLGCLLQQVGRLQRHPVAGGSRPLGLSDREIRVLTLVAGGHGTREIADRLCYSERTVKNVLHDVTSRFQLKNRAQAVAYALREGLI